MLKTVAGHGKGFTYSSMLRWLLETCWLSLELGRPQRQARMERSAPFLPLRQHSRLLRGGSD